MVPASGDLAGPARIISMGVDATNQNFVLGPDGPVYAARIRSTATTGASATPELMVAQVGAAQRLTHLVATRNADVRRLYIDGVLRGSHAVGGSFDSWSNDWTLNVANEASGDRGWLGELHLIRIYDKALTYEEVGRNFSAGPEG